MGGKHQSRMGLRPCLCRHCCSNRGSGHGQSCHDGCLCSHHHHLVHTLLTMAVVASYWIILVARRSDSLGTKIEKAAQNGTRGEHGTRSALTALAVTAMFAVLLLGALVAVVWFLNRGKTAGAPEVILAPVLLVAVVVMVLA